MPPIPGPLSKAPSPRSYWLWLAAAAVLLLGTALRFAYYDTPHGHPDEEITIEVVRHMRLSGDWDVNWAKAALPPDLHYDQYNFSTHLYATYFFYRLVKWVPGTNDWRSRDGGFAVYRFLVALFAAIAVVQTFQLGRRLAGLSAAVGATGLTGLATLLVQDAHYIRPEALTTVLMLAVVALLLPGGSFRRWKPAVAAFAIGLLIACKVSMLLVVWLPFVPLVTEWRKLDRRGVTVAVVAAAVGLGFVAGAPSAVAHPRAFLHGLHALMVQYSGVHPPHSHLHGGVVADMMTRYFVATLGLPTLLCFAVAVYSWVKARRWTELAVVAGPVVLFAGYFATRSVFFERNLSHVVPLFLLLVAIGALEFARTAAHRLQVSATGLATGLFVLLAVHPVQLTAALVNGQYRDRDAVELEQFEAGLRSFYPKAEFWSEMLLTDEPLIRLEDQLRRSRQPILLRVTDYADEGTQLNTKSLLRRFDSGLVADYPGPFGQLPTCTLQAYHSPRYRYFVVRAVRPPKNPAVTP